MITKKLLTEWGLYLLLVVMFIINIGGLILAADILSTVRTANERKFEVLASNQNTLICIVRESTNPSHTKVSIINGEFKYTVDNSYIDKCIDEFKIK